MKGITTALVFCTVALYGCNDKKEIDKQEKVAERISSSEKIQEKELPFEVNLKSPDMAVKSWWAYVDYRERQDLESCRLIEKLNKETILKEVNKVAGPELIDTFNDTHCTLSTYDREISEVKVESETRGIVRAIIKSTTPIPQGASLDKYDEKWRNNGFMYKYLVEKDGSDWKVSRVYKYDETNKYLDKDPWTREYIKLGPKAESYVVNQ